MTASEASDRQQALVLEMLRRARGAPVSFARLQKAGVEFPASVVFELELAGIAVARCRIDEGGSRRTAAVRLDPERDPANESARIGDAGYPAGPVAARTTLDPLALPRPPVLRARRWAVGGALLLIAALVATAASLSVTGLSSVALRPQRPHRLTRPASPAPKHGEHVGTPARRPPHKTAPAPRIHRSSPPPVSASAAETLDIRGHDLLLARDYGPAIKALRAAMAATGEQLTTCRQPSTETCLVYGYALYDIGQALLLGGHPAAAVSVLERRLLIDNQVAVVEAALTVARTRAA